MAFKKGVSPNPAGRPKGAVSKRLQLAKLLEPYSKELIAKMIELALDGDSNALRLCIDRLIPKIRQEPIDIELPEIIDDENIHDLKRKVLIAAIDGRIEVDRAEKLIKLINDQVPKDKQSAAELSRVPSDPAEAARTYRMIMAGD